MNLKNFHAIVGALAQEFRETGLPASDYAQWSILRMNSMYELPINLAPTLDPQYLNEQPSQRLQKFLKILNDEIREGLEVLAIFKVYEAFAAGHTLDNAQIGMIVKTSNVTETKSVEDLMTQIVAVLNEGRSKGKTDAQSMSEFALVSMADWLADMRVYIESEALKYGLPLTSILSVVMGSNFTKLGADGQPIKDEHGKVQKGPNFQKPEPAIHALLFGSESLFDESNALLETANDVSLVTQNVLMPRNQDIYDAAFGVDDSDVEALTDVDEDPEVQSDDGYIDHA